MLLLICGLFLIGCGDNNKNEKVIATVNGSEITQGEFNEYFAMMKNAYELHSGHIINDKEDKELIAELKDEAFEEVILQTIIMQEAEKKKIEKEVSREDTKEKANSRESKDKVFDGYVFDFRNGKAAEKSRDEGSNDSKANKGKRGNDDRLEPLFDFRKK